MDTEKTVAVFIDADNFPYKKVGLIIKCLKSIGEIVMMRAYGNFTKPSLRHWLACTKDYAIKQIQHTDYIKGKNSTDIALIVDCLETAYTNNYDVFVIVSCDSDFTPLIMKLRELHKTVIGFADKQMTEAYMHACNKVVVLSESAEITIPIEQFCKNKIDLDYLLMTICKEYGDRDGFILHSEAGRLIKEIVPNIRYSDFFNGPDSLGRYLKSKPTLYELRNYDGTKASFRSCLSSKGKEN